MLAYTPLDEKSLALLLNYLHDFLKYVQWIAFEICRVERGTLILVRACVSYKDVCMGVVGTSRALLPSSVIPGTVLLSLGKLKF